MLHNPFITIFFMWHEHTKNKRKKNNYVGGNFHENHTNSFFFCVENIYKNCTKNETQKKTFAGNFYRKNILFEKETFLELYFFEIQLVCEIILTKNVMRVYCS